MRVGILGGTFDPIHLGHLAMAGAAQAQAHLDEVLFIPAGDPWQKSDRVLTPAGHRLAMVELAIGDRPGFAVDTREIDRPGPTFTIETLGSFDGADRLFLILGTDAALGLPTWHRADDVVRAAEILVVPRPGVAMAEVLQAVPDAVPVEMKPIDISSTRIRALLRRGESVEGMVPPAVAGYIREQGLYTEAATSNMVGRPLDMEESS